MGIHITQELCTGCGDCVESCPVEAIRLVNQRAVIANALCTKCEACLEACPNGAITAIPEPVPSPSTKALPAAESHMVAAPSKTELPEVVSPTRNLEPLGKVALAFLGTEVAPRVVDVLITALERKLAQPKVATVAPSSTSSKTLTPHRRGEQKQIRYRGGEHTKKNITKKGGE
jgi:NAD-dependent dihydropyrimidine dehydrogenase PreA subunit